MTLIGQGEQKVRVKPKFQKSLPILIQEFEAARMSKVGDPAQFEYFQYHRVISVLETALDFRPDVGESDRVAIVEAAVASAAGEGLLTVTSLTAALERQEIEHIRRPPQAYVLVTSVGLDGLRGIHGTVRHRGSIIRLVDKVPTRFDRSAAQEIAGEEPLPSDEHLLHVLVRLSARSHPSGYEKGRGSIDLLRAIWNYLVMPIDRYYSGWQRPASIILPGPLHTLHDPNGRLAVRNLWYELHPLRREWIYNPQGQWKTIQKRTRRILNRLQRVRYGTEIETGFIRYVRSMDELDHDMAFAKLWGALEYLVASVGDYERLVTRVAFLSIKSERPLVTLMLEHLRDVRNALVHGHRSRVRIWTYLYQLKMFTHRVLAFHLSQGLNFSTLTEAAEYLDSPGDQESLQQKIRDLRRKLRLCNRVLAGFNASNLREQRQREERSARVQQDE